MTSVYFDKRYFVVSRPQIGFLRFLLESYDGLAFARTLDKQSGLVEISYPASRFCDVNLLLNALAEEIGLKEVPVPEQVPPL
jgi:hypothetical protein